MLGIQSWGRILVVVAHADDETLGFGGHMMEVRPGVCHLTDSSEPGSSLGEKAEAVRRAEWEEVRLAAGIPPSQAERLGFPDQRLCFHIQEAAARLIQFAAFLKPDTVITHAYEGGHPDHDAAALVCALAKSTGRLCSRLMEFSLYRNDSAGINPPLWIYGQFLAAGTDTLTVPLTPAQYNSKLMLLSKYTTQRPFLERFDSELRVERFRESPHYAFAMPPHPGQLLYETFDWGITGSQWREATVGAALTVPPL